MKNRIFGLFIFLSLCTTLGFSQDAPTNRQINLQERTPSSPNAGSLGRYFEFPVNLATGITTIQIPLYTLKTGNLSVPITLQYHGGGIRVNDQAGWVGLGWNLTAGGSIIKRTNGLDDFYATTGSGSGATNQDFMHPAYSYIPYNPGFANMTEAMDSISQGGGYSNSTDGQDSLCRFVTRFLKGFVDGQADEFIYSAPDISDQFTYNQKTQQFQTNKPEGTAVVLDNYDTTWNIYSKEGKVYQFNQKEHTVNPLYQKGLSSQINVITAWHLSSIDDLPSGRGVQFYYHNYYYTDKPMGVMRFREHTPYEGTWPLQAEGSEGITRSGDNYLLDSIGFNEGKIYFIKDTATRLDGSPNALKEIRICNNSGTLVKQFLLSYFYTAIDSVRGDYTTAMLGYRLYLKSVQEINYDVTGNSFPNPAYKFTYDTATHLPSRYSYAQDFWGFYNGKHTNSTSIPYHTVYTGGANRRADSNYSKGGILTGIVYPTGGKATFEYTGNGHDSIYAGGLRIKRITNYDSVAQKSLITEYSYPTYGTLIPVFWYEMYHGNGDGLIQSYQYQFRYRLESEPLNPVTSYQGSSVFFSTVEVRQKSSAGDILTKHHFYPQSVGSSGWQNLNGVPHNKVLGSNEALEWKTEYFKREGSGSYTLIQTDSIEYESIAIPEKYHWSMQAAWYLSFGNGFGTWPGYDPDILYPMQFWWLPSMNAYKVFPAKLVKSKQFTIKIPSIGTSLTEASFFEFDNSNGNLKSIKSITSTGDTLTTLIKYASDFIHTGANSGINEQIDLLLDYNFQSAPIETLTLFKKKDSTNSTLQGAIMYEYENLRIKKTYTVFDKVPFGSFDEAYNDNNGFYKDSRYVLYQQIAGFDSEANPIGVSTQGDKESYIWDGDLILAKSANAISEETAFTSFESSQKGHWTYSGSPVLDSTAITGKKAYVLTGGNITISSISNIPYIVSYWSKNGSQSVNSTSSISGRTVNGWTYYEHAVTPTSGLVTVSGSGTIDELRLYPKGSLMTTFAYAPLIGLTSQCDPNNRIQYYEYEGPSKLSLIRDQDRNIIKKFCYNYAGEPESCSGAYGNGYLSQVFTKNNCGGDSLGLSIAYPVYANTYYANTRVLADSLAQADITANGQTYANQNAGCFVIYARMEYSDFYDDLNISYGTVWIKFYSDYACTIPYSVTNLSVNYDKVKTFCNESVLTTDHTVTCNGTGYSLGNQILVKDGTPWATQCYYIEFWVTTGTGYSIF